MHPFPGSANARFVVCCSERAGAVAPSRQQNAILRPARCKRHLFHRQDRTCCAMWIVPSPAEPIVFRMLQNFARPPVVAHVDVPSSPRQTELKRRQQRDQSLTTTRDYWSPDRPSARLRTAALWSLPCSPSKLPL